MAEQALAAKKRGNDFFLKGDWENAASEFSKAIKIDPSCHIYFSNRSACFAEQGKYTQALEDAEECIRLNPTWPKGYSRKAHALYKINSFKEAVSVYKEGLGIDPENASLKEGLKMAEEKLSEKNYPNFEGQNSIFAKMFEKIASDPEGAALLADPELKTKLQNMQSDPNSAMNYVNDPKIMKCMSILLKSFNATAENVNFGNANNAGENENKNNNDESKKSNENLKSQEEIQAEELKLKGNEEYKKKNFEEAIKHYTDAFKLTPKNIVLLTNRSAVHFMKGDLDEAEKDCNEAIKIGKKNFAPFKQMAKAYCRLGDIFAKRNDLEKAIEQYKNSLLESEEYVVKKKLREIQDRKKEKEQREYFDPQKALEHKNKGNELFRESKWKEALDEYSESIKRNPNDNKVYCNRAAVYSKLMAWEYAINDCKKSIELDSNFSKAYLRKGKIEHFLKEYVDAVITFNQGLEIEPDSYQINQAKKETMIEVMKLNRENKMTKEYQSKAMTNSYVQQLVNDPDLREVIENLKNNSAQAQKAMANPEIFRKLEVLCAAGIVQFG